MEQSLGTRTGLWWRRRPFCASTLLSATSRVSTVLPSRELTVRSTGLQFTATKPLFVRRRLRLLSASASPTTRPISSILRQRSSPYALYCTESGLPPAEGANFLQKLLLVAIPATVLYIGGSSLYEFFSGAREKMDLITNRVDMPLILQHIFESTAPLILNHPSVLREVGPSTVDTPKVRTGWYKDDEAWVTYPLRGNRKVGTVMIELLPMATEDGKKLPERWRVSSIEIDLNNGVKLQLAETRDMKPFVLEEKHKKLVTALLQRQKAIKEEQKRQRGGPQQHH